MTEKAGLRRLDFVESYTVASVDKASSIYKSLKAQLLPSFAKVQLEKAEGLTSQYAGPYYGKLVSISQSLLKVADEKVCLQAARTLLVAQNVGIVVTPASRKLCTLRALFESDNQQLLRLLHKVRNSDFPCRLPHSVHGRLKRLWVEMLRDPLTSSHTI